MNPRDVGWMTDLECRLMDAYDALRAVSEECPEVREKWAGQKVLQIARDYLLGAATGKTDIYPERGMGAAWPRSHQEP